MKLFKWISAIIFFVIDRDFRKRSIRVLKILFKKEEKQTAVLEETKATGKWDKKLKETSSVSDIFASCGTYSPQFGLANLARAESIFQNDIYAKALEQRKEQAERKRQNVEALWQRIAINAQPCSCHFDNVNYRVDTTNCVLHTKVEKFIYPEGIYGTSVGRVAEK